MYFRASSTFMPARFGSFPLSISFWISASVICRFVACAARTFPPTVATSPIALPTASTFATCRLAFSAMRSCNSCWLRSRAAAFCRAISTPARCSASTPARVADSMTRRWLAASVLPMDDASASPR